MKTLEYDEKQIVDKVFSGMLAITWIWFAALLDTWAG